MPTTQKIKNFGVNKVESREVFELMAQRGMVAADELYLVVGDEAKDGVTFTPSVSEDGVLTWVNDGNRANPQPVNIKSDPGISATHQWDGTKLTITSASGTSTVDLKGEKGDAGQNATITGVTVSVDDGIGTPSASVTMGGSASARTFEFLFSNLKGEKGERGDGVPSGGTTGQYLTKTTSGTQWSDLPTFVTQAILDEQIASVDGKIDTHTNDTSNPHGVTKEQVGLGNVPNVVTNDQAPTYSIASSLSALTSGEKLSVAFGKLAKAISTLISHIADSSNPHKVTPEQIGALPSSTDYVTHDELEATKYTHPASHPATMITEDETHRFVSDAEKLQWNEKAGVKIVTWSENDMA